MTQTTRLDDLSLHAPAFPGGGLFAALFDRDLMRLSDRGGASGIIGDQWAERCSLALRSLRVTTMDSGSRPALTIERVVRLDDLPQIALAASRRKLQNPDFLLLGTVDGAPAIQAADAKFSVETARSRQVSAEVLAALLEIGPIVTDLVGVLPKDVTLLDGIFLVPDFSLTHYMLRQRRGIRRIAVGAEEIALLAADPDSFLADIDCRGLVAFLAGQDRLPFTFEQSLALTIYYLRLARACVACWLDQTRPLLGPKDQRGVDLVEIERVARSLAPGSRSGWELVLRWDDVAEDVRRQRQAVDHVASLPISGPDLRRQIDEAATAAGVEPPSVNRVRRRIGAWYRQALVDAVGPIDPPVADFSAMLEELGAAARALKPQVAVEASEIILEMVTDIDLASDGLPGET